MCEFVSSNSVFFGGMPSGHFVVARPRNRSVTALIFAGLVTFKIKEPRSIAVLLFEDNSPCSKPCRNRNGSAIATETLIPLPEAIGRSTGTFGRECVTDVPLDIVDMEPLGEVSLNDGLDAATSTGAAIECLN
jgi:hypothetical protein